MFLHIQRGANTFVKNMEVGVCATCLCRGRSLQPLQPAAAAYTAILAGLQPHDELAHTAMYALVCWECAALLRRVVRFQTHALHSQMLLKSYAITGVSYSTLGASCIKFEFDLKMQHIDEESWDINVMLVEDDKKIETKQEPMEEAIEPVKAEPVVDIWVGDQVLTLATTARSQCGEVAVKSEFGDIKSDGHIEDYEDVTDTFRWDDGVKASKWVRHKTKKKKNKTEEREPTRKTNVYTYKHTRCPAKYIQHLRYRDYQCDGCGKGFREKKSLKDHFRLYRGNEKIRCNVCGDTFNICAKVLHLSKHTGDESLLCSFCCKAFTRRVYLLRHLDYHTKEKSFECKSCGKKFLHSKNVRRHEIVHTGEKPFKCDICSRSFNQDSHLRTHMRTHTGEKPFLCSLCSKTFSTAGNLRCHLIVHAGEISEECAENIRPRKTSGDKPFSCSECGKNFSRNQTLRIHMQSHTETVKVHVTTDTGERLERRIKSFSSKSTSLMCSICGKTFSAPISFKMHMRSHSGLKPYECSVCNKKFSVKETLKNHMRIHTGEKPFQCSVCSMKFRQNTGLRSHMVIHTKEKRYECSVCGKKFSLPQTLRIHTRVHTGEKPFSCSVCSRSFTQDSHLKTHMKTHTGEKPYACSICGKMFATAGNLRGHMRVHSGETNYHCSICSKKFSCSRYLKTHMRAHGQETLM